MTDASARIRVTWVVGAALGLLILGAVTPLVASHGFSGLYGQDSFFYHAYSTGPLREAVLAGRLPPEFTWPPGYPILVTLTSLAVGTGSLPGQVVSVAMGALVPVATGLLAAELGLSSPGTRLRAAVPLLAGILVAVTPHLWQSSAVVMSDTTGLAAATFGAWALMRYSRSGEARWAAAAAAVIGFAIMVRWVYALAALPFAAAGIVAAWRAGSMPGRRFVTAAHAGVAALAGLLVMTPLLGPMMTALAAGRAVPFSIQITAHGWDPANVLGTNLVGADGRQVFELPMGLFYLLEPARPYYLGPLFGLAAVVGLVAVARAPSVERVAVLMAWPALVLGFLAGDIYQNTRFALAMLPPLAILAAVGAVTVAARAWRVAPPHGPRIAAGVGIAGAMAIAAMLVGAIGFTDSFIARQQAEQAAIQKLVAQVPADARLVTFGATLSVRQGGRPDALELYDQEPAALVALTGDATPTYLLVPVDGLDGQWVDDPPGLAFAALRDGPGVTLLDEGGAYRLYVVGAAATASERDAAAASPIDTARAYLPSSAGGGSGRR
jgi:hypothetical protein